MGERVEHDDTVLILDSGVGGLSIAESITGRIEASVAYVADTLGFPYGVKNEEELWDRLESIVKHCSLAFQMRLCVIACNTATVIGLAKLRKRFPEITFVGTVPPIKKIENYAVRSRFGLLATEVTLIHSYTKRLHRAFSKNVGMITIPARVLIEKIEQYAPEWDHSAILSEIESLALSIRDIDIEVLVHGCTHFHHVIPLFERYLPHVEHIDSVEGVTQRVEFLWTQELKCSPGNSRCDVYTTDTSESQRWSRIAESSGFRWMGTI